MAITLQGTVHIGLDFAYTKDGTGFSLPGILAYTNSPTAYTSGTGNYQVNAAYAVFAAQLAATSINYDLYGSLVDVYVTTLNLATAKFLYVKNLSTTSGQYLTLSGGFLDGDVSNLGPVGGTSPVIYVGPGGSYLWDSPIDGATVTNGTKERITFTNVATFNYDFIVMGTV